ncbi:hypothetical protein [Flavobacterium sp. LHD-85]|uniref:hypothetical protein n=1 Tax=Flavobacterium sp. LHD-85 TaxID=3071410 RepID=UPI0027E121DF|nr:hypothetical protein [Flavobacterium sp. LHD-85]MDQ6531175.1 hypothetical protein [Flavobacterium sp. LHD-85]
MSTPNINSNIEVYKRLLKAFSVESLKTIFNLSDSKERQAGLLINITNTHNVATLNKIIFDNFSLLKQYVYVYEFKGVLTDTWLDKHPAFINSQKITNSHSIFNLLVPIVYEGYNKAKGTIDKFNFLVPVQIHKRKTVLTIHINILERDISTITTDKIIGATRDLNDEAILKTIVPFANPINLFKYDLNKGIKYLWDIDEIDALKVKFKKNDSTSHEVMDAGKLIKKQMPVLYAELIKTPIRHTIFRILQRQNLVNHFAIDPSLGIINFSVYPPFFNGTNDLIDLILVNN